MENFPLILEKPYTELELCAIYDKFLEITKLPEMSADELWFELDEEKFSNERSWLTKFIWHWEQNV